MSFAWSPAGTAAPGGQSPRHSHVLYEYDGPKLVLALDEHDRQVLGIAVDEAFEERVIRWAFAKVSPAQVLRLLEGAPALREIFTVGEILLVDLAAGGEVLASWKLDGESLPDDILPEADAALPELDTAVRDRLIAAQRLLATEQQRLARTNLLFDGRPVVGRRGIKADFAATALTRYQELVSMAYGSRRKGFLRSTGPIPHRGESTLYLVDMPRGSVGFALEEMAEQGQIGPTGLAEVVSDVGALIDAAAAGDQELADTIGDFDPRVVFSLKELFSVIHKAEATFRLDVNDRTYRFDAERVRMAVERTATEVAEEPDVTFPGVLSGYLAEGRRFELRLEDAGGVIGGRIARESDLDEIRGWFDKRVVAHVRVVTVKRGGQKSHAFTLLRIEPPPAAQS